ncbi:hypothetical protein OsI_31929 [Oryza sativa Indica Group]|uniref:Uncharacterized protein n=1 Tax=Oryza sativa subsp. indica TaxID=39946 RepID=B8BDC9_ORYSI|nr:hypothetical protein OsI_31929 [Oryza sativa Indica Group]
MWKRRRTAPQFFSCNLFSQFDVRSECSDHEVSVETTKSQKHHLKKWQRARLEMRLRRPVIHKDSAILVLNKPTKVPMKGNLPVHNSMDVLAAAALLYGNEEGSKLVHRQRASLLLATAERGSDRRGGGGRGPRPASDPHPGAQDGSAPGPARRP